MASFDETAYLELYSDLPSEWGQAEAFYHYLYFVRYEGRVYDPYDENVFSSGPSETNDDILELSFEAPPINLLVTISFWSQGSGGSL